MKKIFIVDLIIVAVLMMIAACKSSSSKLKEWEKNSFPEFDAKEHVINYRERLDYDIRSELEVPFDPNSPMERDIACSLSFFNYGDSLCLFNGCAEDYFIHGVGALKYAWVYEEGDNITIKRKGCHQKYGDWAIINLYIGGHYFTDVYMTPLATKSYLNGDDSFVFIQFVANEKYMNVLFHAAPLERIILRSCLNRVISRVESLYNVNMFKDAPGLFWQPIGK